MSEIVVGVDGSAASRRALRWALDEARRTDALLLVVHAYRPEVSSRSSTYSYSYLPANAVRLHGEYERERTDVAQATARRRAEALVQRELEAVEAPVGDGGPVVKRVTLAQDPGRALVDLSRNARMLVLGGRTKGGFGGVAPSSVSRRCLDHARCPVVILR